MKLVQGALYLVALLVLLRMVAVAGFALFAALLLYAVIRAPRQTISVVVGLTVLNVLAKAPVVAVALLAAIMLTNLVLTKR